MDIRGAVWLPEHMARGSMQRLPRPPMGDPNRYKTYALLRPKGSHFREVSCEEYECEAFVNGFTFLCDTSTDQGRRQFHYVTHDRSRSYRMERTGLNQFIFHYGPGNAGFAHKHHLPIHRPPRAVVFNGDWRAQTSPVVEHSNVDNWAEDSAEHHDKIDQIRKRG